jgi:hypothetical protein
MPVRDIQQIGTTADKFADNFAGAAFAAGAASLAALGSVKWDVVRDTGGMTVTLANGSLAINTGITANAEFLMLGAAQVCIPANLTAVFSISQRIANQEFRIGYLEVDPMTGLPVNNPNLAGFFRNHTAFLFDGTTATSTVLEAVADNAAARRTVTVTGGASTAGSAEYTIEARNEDITLMSAIADNTGLRTGGVGRLSSMSPNPSAAYRPFVWVRNLATPPAGTTVFTLNRIISMDVQELQAEVGNGRGAITPSGAIPVALVSGGNTVAGSVSTTVANTILSAATNGGSVYRAISAASTNAAVIKASAGRIAGGVLSNTTAAWRWVKLYNKATAPVPGTDIPAFTLGVPPNNTLDIAALFDLYGMFFPAGIGIAITAAAADADNTAVAANEVVVNLLFI